MKTLELVTPTLNIDLIVPSKTNPRKNFDEAQMKDLIASIKEKGITQPISVRPIGENGHKIFEIVAGERRFRAAKALGLLEIPVTVKEMSDSEAMEIQAIENLQRQDLHPLEEADSYDALMKKNNYGADELAVKVGKSKAYIYQRLSLLSLCAPARACFLKNKMPLVVALLFSRMREMKLQEQAFKEISREANGEITFGMVNDHIQRSYMTLLEKAPFDTQDEKLLPQAGACVSCPKRTGNEKELFKDIKRADVCTDVICFQKKKEASWALVAKEAKSKGVTIVEGAEAEKICPYGYLERSSGYVNLNEKCHSDKKGRTWKQIVKKDMPPMTLLRNKREEVFELAQESDLIEALKKAGVNVKKEDRGGSDDSRKEAAKARQTAKVKQMVCTKALERLVKSLETYELKDFSALIAPMVLRNVGYETLWTVAKRRGLVEKRADDCRAKLKNELPKLSESARKGFIVELLTSGDRWSSYSGYGENFKLACEDTRTDLLKIESEVKTILSKTKNARKGR